MRGLAWQNPGGRLRHPKQTSSSWLRTSHSQQRDATITVGKCLLPNDPTAPCRLCLLFPSRLKLTSAIIVSITNLMSSYKNIRINGDRLNSTLQSTCTSWGALSNSTGMRRLALSQEDKEVRDWLVQECKSLGCEVKVDQMGNIFATRAGASQDHKPIGMGSHLDTQPAGIFVISQGRIVHG